MLRIKLILNGKKHSPIYRIGVGEGSAVKETFGMYNPQVSPAEFNIDKKRLEYWLSQGAKLTDSVDQLIRGKYEFKPYSIKKEEAAESGAAPAKPAEGEVKAEAVAQEAPAETVTLPEEEAPAEAVEETKEVGETPSESPKAEEEPEEEKSDEGTA